VEWENTARKAEREGTRVVLLRIGVVLAGDGGALPLLLRPAKLGLAGPLGTGRQYFPWIHVADLVAAIVFALDTPGLAGPVNAVVPNPPMQRDFARALGAAVGRPAFLPTPHAALQLLLGEKADMIVKGQRALPKALRAHGFKFRFPELEDALADLLPA